ncbi:hypothetical protein EXS61_01370 [Candidatus Parcubacteria bacterium]|nr:hypothetical protein [Candidatus Parcubacteria bacterium]
MKKDDTKNDSKADKKYANIKVTNLGNSEVEIEGEIVAEHFEEHRKSALKKLTENAEIPGFRKGFAPENIITARFGNIKILEDAAQEALDSQYGSIVTDYSIRAVGAPQVTITKIAEKNPLGFKIKTAVFPEINLSDYKELAKKTVTEIIKKEETLTVADKEIEDVILQLRKSKAEKKRVGADETVETDETKDGTADKKSQTEKNLPVFDDEFSKSVGDFKTADELREKIKENLLADKKIRAKEKVRLAILEVLIEKTPMTVPELFIESELVKMIAQFKDDISRAGLTYDTYLEHIKKTEDDIRKEWRENAIKRAKTQLILGHVANIEKIVPDEDVVKKEIEHILSHHKDADRFRVRMYVENMLTNEKVLEFLENQG